MSGHSLELSVEGLKGRILLLRGVQVMLDRDLAKLYQVETRALKQAVKRNQQRFPEEFCFELSAQEFKDWRSQYVTSSADKQGLRYRPLAFTEQGIAMLSAVLRSETAIRVSIGVMKAFVEMRKVLQKQDHLFDRLQKLEKRQVGYEKSTEAKFEQVFRALQHDTTPKKGIFFEGQVYDAHVLVSDLIRKAQTSITLIDNYVDDTILTLLDKRKMGVIATIYTKSISKRLKLDLQKHNEQYPAIEAKEFRKAHDRFLVLDNTVVYHLGASLKDLGKKWFAFSKFEKGALEMLDRLEGVR